MGNLSQASVDRRERLAQQIAETGVDLLAEPERLPYEPLGVHGTLRCVVSGQGVLCLIEPRYAHTPGEVLAAFDGDRRQLLMCHPKWKISPTGEFFIEEGKADYNAAVATLIAACARKGPIDLTKQLRGRGAWRSASKGGTPRVLIHLGNRLHVSGQGAVRLGRSGGYIYAGETPLLDSPSSSSAEVGPALLGELEQWRWRLPMLGPRLMQGWIGGALINGALACRPLISLSGGSTFDRATLLELVSAVLGPYMVRTDLAEAQQMQDLLGFDSLAVVIDPVSSVAEPGRRQAGRGEARYGFRRVHRFDGMKIAMAEAARRLRWPAHRHCLDLALQGSTTGDLQIIGTAAANSLRGALLGRLCGRFAILVQEAVPRWISLLRDQQGVKSDAVTALATLLAIAWVIERDGLPSDADVDALAPDIDVLMADLYHARLPAWRRALDGLLALPTKGGGLLRDVLMIAAGYGRAGEADAVLGNGHLWRTEAEAIRHAARDAAAKGAQTTLRLYGLRIVGSDPGYRQLAIAVSAPLRDQAWQVSAVGQRLAEEGLDAVSALAAAPRAERPRSTARFGELGVRHLLLLSLDLVLGEWLSEDTDGVAGAWDQATEN